MNTVILIGIADAVKEVPGGVLARFRTTETIKKQVFERENFIYLTGKHLDSFRALKPNEQCYIEGRLDSLTINDKTISVVRAYRLFSTSL